VTETLSPGLTAGDANPPYLNFGGSLIWIITPAQSGDKISDQTITYSVTGSSQGKYAFNGNIDPGSNSRDTEGSITIMIKEPCTEQWTCGGWTTCQQGTQERTCTDTNNCTLPESRPVMSQACTVADPAPEEQDNPSGDGSGQGQSGDNDNNNISGNGTSGNDTIDTSENASENTSDDDLGDGSFLNQSAIPENIEDTETGDGSQENVSSQAIEDKENRTAEDKITGKALDSAATRNASDSSFSQVSGNNAPSEENNARDNSNMPFITIALLVILAAVIAILGMKRLNLIGTP